MIELIPFRKEDFSFLISWIDNEEDLIQFAGSIFTFPLTINQLDKYLLNSKRIAFKVIEKNTFVRIGHAEIYLNNNKTAKICRVLIGNPLYRGKGLGQQIIKKLVRFAFINYNVKKVELNVFDWNISAIKCYERVGFKIMNGITTTTCVNDKIWTAINMTITENV